MAEPTTLAELAAAHGVGSNYFLGMDFSALFLSGFFPVFLVMFVALLIFTPFGITGMKSTWSWFNDNFLKPSKGYIRVYQELPNDRMRKFWVLPTGKMIKFKSFDGRDIEQPIDTSKGFMLHEGNIPFIRLNQHNKQVFMGPGLQAGNIGQEEITRGFKMAYDTGKMVGAIDAFAEMKTWLIIAVAITLMGAMMSGYMLMEVAKKVDALDAKVTTLPNSEAIAKAFLNATSSGQVGNPSVPTVGGR